MFTSRFSLLLSAFLALAPFASAKDEPTLEQRLDKLAESLEAARDEAHVPGLSIAIVENDEVVWARGFGLADVAAGRPADEGTIYAIGSTTKAFTATLVGMLADEGAMSWDDPVTKYLPYFDLQVRSDDENAECLMRDLLSHRHGFSRMGVLWFGNDVSREKVLRTAAGAEPWDDFRASFHYCNVTYLAAGVAAGVAAGSSWDELMAKRLFEPLGMTSSTLSVREAREDPRLALGYRWDDSIERLEREKMVILDHVGPAGSVNSNVLDMAQWLRLQLGQGEIDGQRLVSTEGLLETWAPQIEMGDGISYGLGWMLREHDGRRVIEHGGNIDGFSAQVAFVPEEQLGYVLLMNLSASPLQQRSVGLVLDALLDEWPEVTTSAGDAEAVDFEDYVGVYLANFATFRDAEFEVLINGDRLALDVPGQRTFDLEPPNEAGEWSFVLTDQIVVSFQRDERGAITGLTMHQGGFHFEVPRRGVEVEPEVPAEELEKFVGTYVRAKGGKRVKLSIERGRLTMEDKGQWLAFHTPDADGHASLRARADQGATFKTDAEGNVESFIYHGNAGDQLFTRLVDSADDELPTLDEVLALRRTDARVAAMKAAGGTKLSGQVRIAQAGVTGQLTIYTRGDDHYASHLDFGEFGRISVAARGDEARSRNSIRGLEVLEGDRLTQALLGHPGAVEGDWREYFDSIEVVARDTVGDRPVHVIRLGKGDLPSRTYRVDAENGDVLRVNQIELEASVRLPVEITYSGFEELDGIRHARHVEVVNPASGKTVLTIEKVESGLELGDEIFRLEEKDEKEAPTGESPCPARGTWSSVPATRWEDAMVSGNGRLGVMVFGDPRNETIVANHCRLFLPLGSRELVPDLGALLPELREVIGDEEDYGGGMGFVLGKAKEQGFPGIINTDPFHPGLFIHIVQDAAGEVRDYSRSEDFATGEVVVRWNDDRGRWSRRFFVSRADHAIVSSLSGSSKLDCDLLFPPLNPTEGAAGGGWVPGVTADQLLSHRTIGTDSVTYHNVYTKGKGGFDAAVRVHVVGGEATAREDGLTIRGADEVLLLTRIVPWKTPLSSDRSEAWAYSPEHPDFAEENRGRYVARPELADSSVVAYTDAAAAELLLPQLEGSLDELPAKYDALFDAHVALHRPLFERVRLDLGAAPEQRCRSSEELLDEAGRSGKLSLALAEKIHDAGRYMFLCCAGELPPNLQGIWTGTWKPAWSGDFTLDTNLQLAVKHGFSGNYPELMEGYFRLMESFFPEWRLNAQRTYGADGFLTNARASNTALLVHWGTWPGIFWTAGCGWLVRPFHEHYLYTGDLRFLEARTVPFLEEIAAFYEDFVVLDESTGSLEFIPSFSPETGSCTTATMDVMVLRDVLTNLIAAYRTLDVKTGEIPKWEALLARLPDYRINDDGALAEWIPEGRSERYRHRHLSHLHSAYEANGELGPDADPTLCAAAREAVRRRIHSEGERSSHGRAHLGLAAAELGMAREAYGRIEVMATGRSMAPSLMCTHEPDGRIFNVDANGALPEIVHRLLFRARPGVLQLLPALPEAWPTGEITGVLAKGRLTLTRLAWDVPARSVSCTLRSQVDQRVSIELPVHDPEGTLTRSVALEAGEDSSFTLTW